MARVLDVGTAETGSPYIVMEYLEGRDLSDLLSERGRLPIPEAIGYVLQAAEAVAEAHGLGIIHRDLKPANLFLTNRPDGSSCVKVLDFGISKVVGEVGSMTQTRAIMGTPHYLSPEQVRSSRSADARSDIWAMGMILYELVTGVVAFPRETLPELCSAIILDEIPPIRAIVPEISVQVEQVIGWALSKAPENRPQSLAELANALAPFVPGGAASAARIARILNEPPRAVGATLPSRAFADTERPPSSPKASSPKLDDAPSVPELNDAASVPEADAEPVLPIGVRPGKPVVLVGVALALASIVIVVLALARSTKPPIPTPIAASVNVTAAPPPLATVLASPEAASTATVVTAVESAPEPTKLAVVPSMPSTKTSSKVSPTRPKEHTPEGPLDGTDFGPRK